MLIGFMHAFSRLQAILAYEPFTLQHSWLPPGSKNFLAQRGILSSLINYALITRSLQ